jgi:hypothetical protein
VLERQTTFGRVTAIQIFSVFGQSSGAFGIDHGQHASVFKLWPDSPCDWLLPSPVFRVTLFLGRVVVHAASSATATTE